jgi:hypothetical protein
MSPALDPPSPPQAPLAFRVGITGHRPNRLVKADMTGLARVLRAVLATVKEATEGFDKAHELYAKGNALLRAVSPLAEGSDRVFAEAALDLGFALCCPMPFSRDDFVKDFTEPDSVKRFEQLVERARRNRESTIFELDGVYGDPCAYATNSNVVLNQSDLLVVVWDGEERARRGGTEETFAEARRRGVPVVWVDAQAPHAWQLVSPSIPYDGANAGVRARPSGDMDLAVLGTIVREILDVPFPKPADHPPVHPEAEGKRRKHLDGDAYRNELIKTLKQFYSERKRRIAFGPLVWALFGNAVAEFRMGTKGIVPPDFGTTFAPEWQEAEADETSSSRAVVDQVMKQIRPYFVWPDALAVRYAQAYRGAFLALYAFSAIAVGAALLPSAAGWMHEPGPPARSETACVLVEFSVILLVVALVFFGRRQRWHGRWTDYRLAAELLRPLSVLALLGGSRPLPQLPAHLATYGSPSSTWMAWYVRAVERAIGLPTARVNRHHLLACLRALAKILRAQLKYHGDNDDHCDRMERHLHIAGLSLLGVTLFACMGHLLPIVSPYELPFSPAILVFVGGFLPALGAAFAGISNQAEFLRVAKRSEAMALQLGVLLAEIPKVRSAVKLGRTVEGTPYLRVVKLIGQASELMVNEVLDWRVVLLDRPLNPPG